MKYTYLFFGIAVSSVLFGCQKPSPTPAPEEAGKEPNMRIEAKESAKVEMPAQFRGQWSVDCADEESTSALEIGQDTITYYESSGSIKAIVQRGDLEVATISEVSGEGEAWLSLAKFRLANGNKTLLDVTNESEAAFSRDKCETVSKEASASSEPNETAPDQEPIVSIEQLALKVKEAPYKDVKNALLELGFSPLKDADRNEFNMDVSGDPAACGNRGCAIPWSGQAIPVFCVGVSVNDNIDQSLWSSRIGPCD